MKSYSKGGNIGGTPTRLSKVSLQPEEAKSQATKTLNPKQLNLNQKVEIYSKNEKGEVKLYDGMSPQFKTQEKLIQAREQHNTSKQAMSHRNLVV